MAKKKMTLASAAEVVRLRGMKDDWGDALYSAEKIADMLGVSESTVWRVIKGVAAYRKLQNTLAPADALASQERVLEMLKMAPTGEGETSNSLEKLQKELAEQTRPISLGELQTQEGQISPETKAKLQEMGFIPRKSNE